MLKYIWAYLATALVFLPIDFLWLGVLAKKFYAKHFGDMLQLNVGAAVSFYLIYIAGIVFFAVAPAIEKQSLATAALLGALFGFFCYATYDLTNLATLRDFPSAVVIPDIIWGIFLTGSSAAGGYLIYQFAAKTTGSN